MICQNCHTQVDDDLIFCTNCGERLSATSAQTVLLKDSADTKPPTAKLQKSSSKIKWIALIVALIAIPASIFGIYLLRNNPKYPQVAQNANKQTSPVQSPTRKTDTQNINANVPNVKENSAETNLDENASTSKDIREIMNERIEIAPKSHYAKPFKIVADTAKFIGKVEILQGESYKGFVYLQYEYDEHFPDETYKMFIFGEEKMSDINATLVKENYVLIFVNDSEKSVMIQASFSVE